MVDSLAPGFLVASPGLRDPDFVRAVVLLVEHGPDGSLGFVVNRPAPVTFAQVAEVLSLEPSAAQKPAPVFVGGPVAPESGWILFDPSNTAPDVLADAVQVSKRLAVSASRALLETIAGDAGPDRRLIALGYAGWAAGQLDGEFQRGVWIPVDLDDEIVFDIPPDERWHVALKNAGIDPARMSGGGIFSA